MTVYREIHPVSGLTIYAYPVNPTAYPLSAWTTHRVLTTATDKVYEATVDLNKSDVWAMFVGATQPVDYDAAIYTQVFFGSSSAPVFNITPGTFSSLNRNENSVVVLYFNENSPVVIPIDIDITAIDVRFVVENSAKVDVLTIANASITKSTTAFTVTIPTTITSTITNYIWSLRATATDKVLVQGTIQVRYSPF